MIESSKLGQRINAKYNIVKITFSYIQYFDSIWIYVGDIEYLQFYVTISINGGMLVSETE